MVFFFLSLLFAIYCLIDKVHNSGRDAIEQEEKQNQHQLYYINRKGDWILSSNGRKVYWITRPTFDKEDKGRIQHRILYVYTEDYKKAIPTYDLTRLVRQGYLAKDYTTILKEPLPTCTSEYRKIY